MKYPAVCKLLVVLVTALCSLASYGAAAEVAVIVHPSNTNEISKNDIARIFLGKKKEFPDGSDALPVSQVENSPVSDEFIEKVLDKTAAQHRSYWSQLVFTGKGRPPKEIGRDAEVKKVVSENPAVIGFIDMSAVDESVRVVAQF